MHTYVEAATRRSFYAANTGLSCAINHCHPRSREKVRGGRAGRKLGHGEKQKNEERWRRRRRRTAWAVFRLLYRCRFEREMLHCRSDGTRAYFRSTRYTAGICRAFVGETKKKDRKCSTSSELTFRIVLQRQLTFCDRKLGSSRRFIEQLNLQL